MEVGRFKVFQVHLRKDVSPSHFCKFLELTLPPPTRSRRYQSPDNSQSRTGTRTHLCTEIQVQQAQRLPTSFQTARVTVQIERNAAVPLHFPARASVPTDSSPLPLLLLPSALPAQVSLSSAFK